MEKKELGKIIKRRRHVLGLTIRELASLTDISKTTISQIERGIRNPTFEMLQNIFDFLNLEMRIEVKKRN